MTARKAQDRLTSHEPCRRRESRQCRPLRPAGCPSWCEVDNHFQYDDGKGSHFGASHYIQLSAHPSEPGFPPEFPFEQMIVDLEIDAERAVPGPWIKLTPRDESSDSTMLLTVGEAWQLIAALRELVALAGGAR